MLLPGFLPRLLARPVRAAGGRHGRPATGRAGLPPALEDLAALDVEEHRQLGGVDAGQPPGLDVGDLHPPPGHRVAERDDRLRRRRALAHDRVAEQAPEPDRLADPC